MASQIERVAAELRRRILSGELRPGERIVELHYAPELGASRTPLRLALGELERQGLLERVGKRGFQVRRVTLEDVAQAIDVRGVLEGLAVRVLAETGVGDEARHALEDCIAEGRALLDAPEARRGRVDTAGWAAMNARFHRILAESSGNHVLCSALEHVTKAPLAAAGALGFSGVRPSLEVSYLQRAQTDHEDVLQAILARAGTRAEALMREHALRSRDNKRALAQQSGASALEPDAGEHAVTGPRRAA
jgi:GntR family transcriptional regulator, vanillate catabolism transcriptional regulator